MSTMRERPANDIRPTTINIERLSQRELDRWREDGTENKRHLPLTRGECPDDDVPCPYVSCRHHLFLDVDPLTGSIKLNFPALLILNEPQVEDMVETCALRVAARGGTTLDVISHTLNITRERIRQVEEIALRRLRTRLAAVEGIEAHDGSATLGVWDAMELEG